MSWQSDFYNSVYSTARAKGASDAQAHLAAAQASQETGFGKHVVGNSYFGIKASPNYTGPTQTFDTHEEIGGQSVGMKDRFRSYQDLADSVQGYLDFMPTRFSAAWNSDNLWDAVKNLGNGDLGRYATDSQYENKVGSIANRYGPAAYQLHELPADIPTPMSPDQVQEPDAYGLLGVIDPATPGQVTQGGLLSAPVDVSATGLLGPGPDLSASARAVPSYNVPATAELGLPQGLAAGGILTPQYDVPATAALGTTPDLSAATTVAGNMSMPTVDVQKSGFTPSGMPQTTNFDMGRFGTPQITANAQMTAGVGAGLPATATVPSLMSAPEFAARVAAEPVDVQASGLLGPGPDLSAQATVPSLMSAQDFAAATAPTGIVSQPAQTAPQAIQAQANPNALSPAAIAGYQQLAQTAPQAGVMGLDGVKTMSLAGDLNVSNPAMPSVAQPGTTVEDKQMANATEPTVPGPAVSQVTPQATQMNPARQAAVTQAINASAAQAAKNTQAPEQKGLLGGMLTKEAMIGGLLGSAALGPVGGLLGGLLGRQMANGSISNPFSGNSQPISINNIGMGLANTSSVWGGGMAPGTQATANNGGLVTSLGNGDVAYTNPNNVTSVTLGNGMQAADWSNRDYTAETI